MLFHKKIITKKKQEVSQVLDDFLFLLLNDSAKLTFKASTLSVYSHGRSISVRTK